MAEQTKRITCGRCDADFGERIDRPELLDNSVVHNCPAVPMETACWIWRGRRSGDYASMKIGRRHVQTGRVMLGIADEGKRAIQMHACDNPPCVSPVHIRIGTIRENALDMVRKGRHRTEQQKIGIANRVANASHNRPAARIRGSDRINEFDVPHIRAAASVGIPHSVIARHYGVSPDWIGKIARHEAWK